MSADLEAKTKLRSTKREKDSRVKCLEKSKLDWGFESQKEEGWGEGGKEGSI